mgnify:CR=1 FL=1
MSQTILANAKLVLHDEVIHGALRIENGHITAIDPGAAVPKGAIDCEGDLVMPGLIELHTDNLERHIEPRPRVNWPHASAIIAHDAELVSVGITTVFDALRVGSVTSKKKANYGEYARQLADEILDLRAKGALRISHFLHLRAEVCSETLIAELAKFGPDDRIGIVSLMDHTPGQRQFRDLSQLRAYVCGKHGLSDLEFESHVARHPKRLLFQYRRWKSKKKHGACRRCRTFYSPRFGSGRHLPPDRWCSPQFSRIKSNDGKGGRAKLDSQHAALGGTLVGLHR